MENTESTILNSMALFDYLNNHPEVGVMLGSGLIAGGIAAVVIYGKKSLHL